jgi:hypothetical protein
LEGIIASDPSVLESSHFSSSSPTIADTDVDSPIIVILLPIGVLVPVHQTALLAPQDTPRTPTPTPTLKLANSGEDVCIGIFGSDSGEGVLFSSQDASDLATSPTKKKKFRKQELTDDRGRKKTPPFQVFHLVWWHIQVNQ